MTRRTILVLSGLFSSLVVAGIASPVSADAPCGRNAQGQCAQMTDDAALIPAQVDASPAQATEQMTIYRVSSTYLYVPRPDGMWAVVHAQPDGRMITEDYVSGPPPVNGIAINP